ncbi:hypothetical protein [Arthrobacter sp. 31Y]|uniref:hypothetical protein n=1 Tax=Arthrobacter sp. 31Y TaxID=1115632 RepID=UPI000465C41A|nr:hypothetical protein [Arthrobacter sp. 31Y]
MTYWNFGNTAYIAAEWPESEDLDPMVYDNLFQSANALCVAYAPALPEGAEIPAHYLKAEVVTARDIASKMTGGNTEEVGLDGQIVRTLPLIWLAQSLLRPKTNPIGRLR